MNASAALSTRAARSRLLWWTASAILTVACVDILWLGATDYDSFFPDDSFISLRYAQRLLAGRGPTWTDGERVEGYSNLLWVLLVAAGGVVSRNLVLVARVIGSFAAASGVVALFAAYRPRRARELLPPVVGSLLYALSGPIQAWSGAGLEQALLAPALVWAVVSTYPVLEVEHPGFRDLALPGIAFGAITLTRPDGALFAAAAAAGLVLSRGLRPRSLGAALRLASIALACFTVQLAFRRAYYGEWVPNTFYAKVAFSWPRARAGWEYVRDGLEPNLVLLLFAALAVPVAAFDAVARRRLVLAGSAAAAWTAYVVAIGGDIFPQKRHLVPLIALLAVMSTESLRAALRWGRGSVIALAAASPVLLLAYASSQRSDVGRASAQRDLWHWPGREVGLLFRQAFFEESPLVAVDAAGAFPYYYQLPTLDMLGLSDRWIAHHPPADLGAGFIGHELGDGAYVLSRKPDVVLFHDALGSAHSTWRGGCEMEHDPSFARLYQLVRFDAERPVASTALAYVRRDGRVGIRREGDCTIVPGYLFDAGEDAHGRLGRGSRMELRVPERRVAELRGLALAAGRYALAVEAEGVFETTVVLGAAGTRVPLGAAPTAFSVPRALSASVTIELRPAGGEAASLGRVTLTRLR